MGVQLLVDHLVGCSADFPVPALGCSVNHSVLVWFVDQFLAAVYFHPVDHPVGYFADLLAVVVLM